jgi:hypothetical protein
MITIKAGKSPQNLICSDCSPEKIGALTTIDIKFLA